MCHRMILSKQIQEESLEEAVTAGSLPWFLRPPEFPDNGQERELCPAPPPPSPLAKGRSGRNKTLLKGLLARGSRPPDVLSTQGGAHEVTSLCDSRVKTQNRRAGK